MTIGPQRGRQCLLGPAMMTMLCMWTRLLNSCLVLGLVEGSPNLLQNPRVSIFDEEKHCNVLFSKARWEAALSSFDQTQLGTVDDVRDHTVNTCVCVLCVCVCVCVCGLCVCVK